MDPSLHLFDFIFSSGQRIDKGNRDVRAFYLVLLSSFNGALRQVKDKDKKRDGRATEANKGG